MLEDKDVATLEEGLGKKKVQMNDSLGGLANCIKASMRHWAMELEPGREWTGDRP